MSEHLIENLNHPTILSPEDAMPKMIDDDQEQIIARHVYEKQVKRRLEDLDPSRMSFRATGEVPITLVIGGEEQEVLLPIRTIPAHIMYQIGKEYQDCYAAIPRKWNPEGGEWDAQAGRKTGGWDQDQSHPEFREIAVRLIHLARQLAYDKVLEGIDINLKDMNGQVVWSHRKNIKNRDAAIESLNYMGIGDSQIAAISEAIDELTEKAQKDDKAEFEKKS